jgi:3-methyladenine DNA glycosylase AlkC
MVTNDVDDDDDDGVVVAERFSLKDQLFNEGKIVILAAALKSAYSEFPVQQFQNDVVSQLSALGLKQRIAYIAECMERYLPTDYEQALDILLQSLPPKLDPTKNDGDFGDFIWAPHSHFVETNGCVQDHLQKSLLALYEITQRFTAESSIRPFLNEFPDETMHFLEEKCVSSTNYHVRRLASEGTRPKLPWASRLTNMEPRRPVDRILERLVCDETRYVTRSVANHLNDVSKVDPEFVVETLGRWRDQYNSDTAPDLVYVTKHALRTLVKQSYGPAVEMLGYATSPGCSIVKLSVPDSVEIGSSLEFSIELQAHEEELLWITYAIRFHSPKRKVQPKVFQWKKVDAKKHQMVSLRKKHSFRITSTRTLHAGEHWLTVRVNGKDFDSVPFTLKK